MERHLRHLHAAEAALKQGALSEHDASLLGVGREVFSAITEQFALSTRMVRALGTTLIARQHAQYGGPLPGIEEAADATWPPWREAQDIGTPETLKQLWPTLAQHAGALVGAAVSVTQHPALIALSESWLRVRDEAERYRRAPALVATWSQNVLAAAGQWNENPFGAQPRNLGMWCERFTQMCASDAFLDQLRQDPHLTPDTCLWTPTPVEVFETAALLPGGAGVIDDAIRWETAADGGLPDDLARRLSRTVHPFILCAWYALRIITQFGLRWPRIALSNRLGTLARDGGPLAPWTTAVAPSETRNVEEFLKKYRAPAEQIVRAHGALQKRGFVAIGPSRDACWRGEENDVEPEIIAFRLLRNVCLCTEKQGATRPALAQLRAHISHRVLAQDPGMDEDEIDVTCVPQPRLLHALAETFDQPSEALEKAWGGAEVVMRTFQPRHAAAAVWSAWMSTRVFQPMWRRVRQYAQLEHFKTHAPWMIPLMHAAMDNAPPAEMRKRVEEARATQDAHLQKQAASKSALSCIAAVVAPWHARVHALHLRALAALVSEAVVAEAPCINSLRALYAVAAPLQRHEANALLVASEGRGVEGLVQRVRDTFAVGRQWLDVTIAYMRMTERMRTGKADAAALTRWINASAIADRKLTLKAVFQGEEARPLELYLRLVDAEYELYPLADVTVSNVELQQLLDASRDDVVAEHAACVGAFETEAEISMGDVSSLWLHGFVRAFQNRAKQMASASASALTNVAALNDGGRWVGVTSVIIGMFIFGSTIPWVFRYHTGLPGSMREATDLAAQGALDLPTVDQAASITAAFARFLPGGNAVWYVLSQCYRNLDALMVGDRTTSGITPQFPGVVDVVGQEQHLSEQDLLEFERAWGPVLLHTTWAPVFAIAARTVGVAFSLARVLPKLQDEQAPVRAFLEGITTHLTFSVACIGVLDAVNVLLPLVTATAGAVVNAGKVAFVEELMKLNILERLASIPWAVPLVGFMALGQVFKFDFMGALRPKATSVSLITIGLLLSNVFPDIWRAYAPGSIDVLRIGVFSVFAFDYLRHFFINRQTGMNALVSANRTGRNEPQQREDDAAAANWVSANLETSATDNAAWILFGVSVFPWIWNVMWGTNV